MLQVYPKRLSPRAPKIYIIFRAPNFQKLLVVYWFKFAIYYSIQVQLSTLLFKKMSILFYCQFSKLKKGIYVLYVKLLNKKEKVQLYLIYLVRIYS